jgi:WD40 repeat protein
VASRAAATQRQRGAVGVGLVLTLVMAGLAIFAGVQWHSADVQRKAAVTQREIAVSRALAAQSGNELLPDPQLGLLLALRAYGTSPTTQAEAAVRAAAGASTVRGYLPPLRSGSADDLSCPVNTSGPGVFDPSGQYVVVTCAGYVEVWRWASRHGPGSADHPYIAHPGGSPSGAVFSRPGNQVLFAGPGGRIYQWTWRAPQRLQVIGRGFKDPVILPTPAGILVAGENGHEIAITNISKGSVSSIRLPCCSYASPSLGNPPFVFNPAVTELAVLTSRNQQSPVSTLSVFDLRDGALIFSKTVPGATLPIALSSDGRVAVAAGQSAQVFSVAHPAQPPVVDNLVSPAGLPAHCCDVDLPLAMTWSPDGRALAVGSEDLWTRVWLPDSATPVYLDDSAENGSTGLAFSPNGQYLLTSGFASQVWQWQAATPMSVPATGPAEGTAVSPNGQTFAVAESDNKILLWDWRTSQLRTLTITDSHAAAGGNNTVYLAFSPNGRSLISAGPDDYLRFWNLASFTRYGELKLPGAPASIAYSPDGSYLGVAWIGGVARWNTTSATSKPLVIWQPYNYGGLILSLSNTGALQMLAFPPLHTLSLTGHLIDAAAGSDRSALIARVSIPGNPGTTGTLLPGHRLLLCGQTCFLYAIGNHSAKLLKAPAIKDQAGFSLSTDRHILYLTALGGIISAWDLQPADPAVAVTTAPAVVAVIQAGTTPGDLLLASQSSLQLLPTAQYQAFPAVLRLARSEAVRAFTPAERLEYLTGASGG